MRYLLITIIFLTQCAFAQKQWRMEAEDPSSKVTYLKDGVIDIIAPKGLTLWHTSDMKGNITIDYDARIVVDDNMPTSTVDNPQNPNRLSDLNCFWLATDPKAKNGSVFTNMKQRGGKFVNQYALQLYYMGYGGNHNSTTRFRRYDGDTKAITDANIRPAILREYLEKDALLKPNHWYHIHIEQRNDRIIYTIDNKTLVDYVDATPHKHGYFGFRTTLAHAQLRNFTYTETSTNNQPIPLRWIGGKSNTKDMPQTFGVPFAQGEMNATASLALTTDKGEPLPHDEWTLAKWPDGSVKWKAVSTVIPHNTKGCELRIQKPVKATGKNMVTVTDDAFIINTAQQSVYVSRHNGDIIDSIVTNGHKTASKTWLEYDKKRLKANAITLEQNGDNHSVIKMDGEKFTLRLYAYRQSNELKVVHTLIVDSAMNADGIHELGLKVNIPMQDADHKRGIAFAKGDDGGKPTGLLTEEQALSPLHFMAVKPLIARRPIALDENGMPADARSQKIANDIASWDGFRLSQISPNSYSIRKRATAQSPWIGTIEGKRATGEFAIGDSKSHVSIRLNDFWQSYPSSLQVDNARSQEATATVWLWSPEAEAMSFEHYDTIPHGLEAAYEDVQPGMSTAYGIARTSTIYITPSTSAITEFCAIEDNDLVMLPTPEYLHEKRAFGFWSLPSDGDIEQRLNKIATIYDEEIERNAWYGYFNYGDFMHSYDRSRGEWRYDVGGYAWDNTELATNAMLWYSFLRTGDPSLWRMSVAMTRHTAEVDCYHAGPHAGLGSRHNVSHWGCGAKEARISQAFWNRFLYYLTADERCGDLMSEVKDADQLLYTLDPMRLAQPRSADTPCTAPARLRVGPDWVAYAGNWFTEWERTGNTYYYNKILNGMNSIAALPHGIFSGPKALGYDPATGIVSWEGNPDRQNTNHLLAIMGGFEMMNEMMLSIDNPSWAKAWLNHAAEYKEKAIEISGNKFRIPRLKAYAWWKTGNKDYLKTAMDDLWKGNPFGNANGFFTNDAATWGLDAIFMQEVMR